MTMSITDITSDFFAFWERAEELAPAEQHRLWYELYEAPHDNLFPHCGDRHGTPAALPAALERFPSAVPHMRDVLPLIRTAIERTGPEIAELFALDRLDLRSVLLVGMFWSDGWVVDVDGHPTCFIAVETIGSATRANLLLPHEAAHVAHAACLGGEWAALDTLGCDLFLEGLATLASARIVPSHDETTYLWAGLERTWHGVSMPEWLAHCETSWPIVRSRLLRDISSKDPEVTAPYVLGDRAPQDQPARMGYFVGLRLVSALARKHAIAELARWPAERVQEEMTRALTVATETPPRFDG